MVAGPKTKTESRAKSPALRFAANVSTMFREAPLPDRFDLAAKAGFEAVELQYPYSFSASELRSRLDGAGLTLELMNAPPGNTDAGERGLACLPERIDDFRQSIEIALEYAAALQCGKLHILSGIPSSSLDPVRAWDILASNLIWASERCASAGIVVLVEALNALDVPGYAIATQKAAARLVSTVDHMACRLQFDTYHCAAAGDDVINMFDVVEPLVAHVQIADWPGRAEPGSGSIDWVAFFERIASSAYQDYIGCEYTPLEGTEAGLRWLRDRQA